MDKKKAFLNYLEQTVTIFGITIVVLIPITALVGEYAKDISSVFCLGSKGISIASLLQFLLNAACICVQRTVFFTDLLLKKSSTTTRIILMILGVTLQVGLFAYCFAWFPIDDPLCWLSYFISFLLCFFLSVTVSSHREKSYNTELENGLRKLKEEHSDGNA